MESDAPFQPPPLMSSLSSKSVEAPTTYLKNSRSGSIAPPATISENAALHAPANHGRQMPPYMAGTAAASHRRSSAVETPELKRKRCCARLLQSEREYVGMLSGLKQIYLDPLERDAQLSKPRLLPKDVNTRRRFEVFLSIFKHVITVSTNFLKELDEKCGDGSDDALGQILEEHAPLFRMYTEYSMHYGEAIAMFARQASSSAAFRDYITEAERDPRCGAHNIRELVTVPVSRIGVYLDFLKKLIGLVGSGHSDQPKLLSASEQFKKLQAAMDDASEREKDLEVIRELEKLWDRKFVVPGRTLIHQGILTKVSRKKNHVYHFVLFSDILMYGSERKVKAVSGRKFDHHRTLALQNMMVDDVPGHEQSNAFQLRSDEKSFVVFASSKKEKFDWMVYLHEAMSEAKEKGSDVGHDGPMIAPVWAPDSQSKVCTLCSSQFSMFNRRHHCRICGRLVCGSCSKARHNKMRMCKSCAQHTAQPSSSEPKSSSPAPPSPVAATARANESANVTTQLVGVAQYDFAPVEADDLALAVGDVVYIDELKEPWAHGRKAGTDAYGWFPSEFVAMEERQLESNRPSQSTESRASGLEFHAKSGHKRSRVVHEILTTEVTYLNGLKKLLDVYVRPLLADFNSARPGPGNVLGVKIANNASSLLVFMSIVENMGTLSANLVDDLTELANSWEQDGRIGKLFCRYAPLFTIYDEYSKSFEFANKTLEDYKKSSGAYRKFMKEAAESCGGVTLQSLLILPIQRVPRYLMLLKEVLKRTPEEYADHADVERAMHTIQGVATHINEKVREREAVVEVRELERQWSGIDLLSEHAGRRVVKKGELHKRSRKRDIPYHFVLFNDALMYGSKELTGDIKLHRMIPLDQCDAREIQESGDAPSTASAADAVRQFDIVSSAKSFRAIAPSAAERDSWLKAISEAAVAHRTSKGMDATVNVAPVWTQDGHSSQCTFCNTSFTMMRRRHHCRSCGSVVCGDCSTRRLRLTHVNEKKAVRVCDKCYANLKDELGDGDDFDTRPSRGSSAAARFMSKTFSRMTLKRGFQTPVGRDSWRKSGRSSNYGAASLVSASSWRMSGGKRKSWRRSAKPNAQNGDEKRRSFAAEGVKAEQLWTSNPIKLSGQHADPAPAVESSSQPRHIAQLPRRQPPKLAPRPRKRPPVPPRTKI